MLRHTLVTSLCSAALVAACSNGGMTDPSTIAPTVATAAVATSTTTSAGTSAPTSVAAASTSAPPSTAVPTVTLSPDGPWTRVDSAPGITTAGLVYELMPKLWVYLPTEIDLEHGITWTFNETDRPVIEAYLQAQRAYFEAGATGVLDDDLWRQFFAPSDGTAEVLRSRLADSEHIDLADGVVLRPMVLGEDRTDTGALIFDCVLDGSVFLTASGQLAEGSTWGVLATGGGSRLAIADGVWRVTQTGRQPEACL